jgi:hypothetical protein
MTQQNITRSEVEHVQEAALRERVSVMSALHNISSRLRSRHMTPSGVLGGGTGVLIVDLQNQVLRNDSVQAPLRRSQPFYPRVALPSLLERRHLVALNLGQVQAAAVAEPQTGIHERGV